MLNKKGVTLVELLLVFALLGIITTLAFSFYFFGSETFKQGEEQRDIQFQMRMASSFITDKVRNAKPVEIAEISSFDNNYYYFYLEDGMLKYRQETSGDITELTDSIVTNSTDLFEIRKDNNKYLLYFVISGTEGDNDFFLETEILLNNIFTAAEDSGNAIRFKK